MYTNCVILHHMTPKISAIFSKMFPWFSYFCLILPCRKLFHHFFLDLFTSLWAFCFLSPVVTLFPAHTWWEHVEQCPACPGAGLQRHGWWWETEPSRRSEHPRCPSSWVLRSFYCTSYCQIPAEKHRHKVRDEQTPDEASKVKSSKVNELAIVSINGIIIIYVILLKTLNSPMYLSLLKRSSKSWICLYIIMTTPLCLMKL